MRQNFAASLRLTLEFEGGYSDEPGDPGGPTNLGVTLATWSDWIGHPATPQMIEGLSLADVGGLYRARFWDAVNGDNLPGGLDCAVFDAGVNIGPETAAKLLQQLLSVLQDGVIGVNTLKAIGQFAVPDLIERFSDARIAFYQRLPGFGEFGSGWTRRTRSIELSAQQMA